MISCLMELTIFGGNERLDNKALSIDFSPLQCKVRLVNVPIAPWPYV